MHGLKTHGCQKKFVDFGGFLWDSTIGGFVGFYHPQDEHAGLSGVFQETEVSK